MDDSKFALSSPRREEAPGGDEGFVFTTREGRELAKPVEGTRGWLVRDGVRHDYMFTRGQWRAFLENATESWA